VKTIKGYQCFLMFFRTIRKPELICFNLASCSGSLSLQVLPEQSVLRSFSSLRWIQQNNKAAIPSPAVCTYLHTFRPCILLFVHFPSSGLSSLLGKESELHPIQGLLGPAFLNEGIPSRCQFHAFFLNDAAE
jgi:hypothetical protein